MTKPTLRQGMDEFFPPKSYIEIMKQLIDQGQKKYSEIKGSDLDHHGIKLHRMVKQGLIEKVGWGEYKITEEGRKIMRAVAAYKKEMAK